MARPSVVVVNTGDGKGKSSSAFGVRGRAWARGGRGGVGRAWGRGWRVVVVQFIKADGWNTGEKKLADHLGVEWHTLGDGFTWESTDLDETEAKGRHAWEVAKQVLAAGEHQLVILDELTYAITFGWIDESDVVETLRTRAPKTSVVITGRDATEGVIAVADTVTEMRKVKHAYDTGIKAIKGIEY